MFVQYVTCIFPDCSRSCIPVLKKNEKMFSFITEGVGWEIPGKITQNLFDYVEKGRGNFNTDEWEKVISIKVTE